MSAIREEYLYRRPLSVPLHTKRQVVLEECKS